MHTLPIPQCVPQVNSDRHGAATLGFCSAYITGHYAGMNTELYALGPHMFSSLLQASEIHAQLHQKLSSAVTSALKKGRGKVIAFKTQLKESSNADDVQLKGDMVTANLYRIQQGDASCTVEDWNTGQPVTIALDPMKPPVQVRHDTRVITTAFVNLLLLSLCQDQDAVHESSVCQTRIGL